MFLFVFVLYSCLSLQISKVVQQLEKSPELLHVVRIYYYYFVTWFTCSFLSLNLNYNKIEFQFKFLTECNGHDSFQQVTGFIDILGTDEMVE